MWRAFFFAIGTTLILLGAQGLVVDHIVIANGTRVPGFVAKYLSDHVGGQAGGGIVAPIGTAASNPNLLQPGGNNGAVPSLQALANRSNQTGSLFGPSRFGDSQLSNTNLPRNISYYGGVPSSSSGQFPGQPNLQANSPSQFSSGQTGSNPQFSFAGYDRQAFNNPAAAQTGGVPAGQGNRLSTVTLGQGGSRFFQPADWMPWGLLAVGTLVVLYTKSTGRGFTNE